MQSTSSTYRNTQTISTFNRNGSSFVITTNGQNGRSFGSRQLQQAKSSTSVDINQKQRQQQLIMKILMMAFQIQRKDVVVKNLIKQLQTLSTKTSFSNSQQLYSLQQQLSKTKRYSQQLQYKVQQLQLINKQIQTTKKSTYRQLQEKITFLQMRNKQLQVKNIQLQNQYKKILTQVKMVNYKLVNIQSTQKGKNRQMQNEIINMQKRIDEEKKVANQLKIIIESKYEQIRVMKENEQRMVREFQDRMRIMENQLNHREDLKRSQAINSQQKIQMTQQELIRMQEEIKFLRKKLDDQQINFDRKQQELLGDLKRAKDIQAELFSSRHQNNVFKSQLDQRNHQINNLARQLNDLKSAYTRLQQQKANNEQQTHSSFQQKLILIKQQAQHYRSKLLGSQSQIDTLRSQNRKLKRKSTQPQSLTQCTSCKILQSATSIKSIKVINDVNLTEIIQQTQKLHNSSLKIQQMLSARRISKGGSGYGNGQMYGSQVSVENRSYYYQE